MVIQSTRKQIVFNKKGYHIESQAIVSNNKDKETGRKKYFAVLAHSAELGFILSLPIVFGAIFGSYLDKNLGTEPKLTLSLIFMGVFISLANLYNFTKY